MSDASAIILYQAPTKIADVIAQRKRLLIRHVCAGIVLTLLLGGLYLVGNGNIALPLIPIIVFGIIGVLWTFPGMFIPFTVACACLIETQMSSFADSSTDRIPIFWDVNTIFQIYGHADFHGFPLTMFEVLMIIVVVSALIRGVYFKKLNLKSGAFLLPILGYMAFVIIGLLNGDSTGGDSKIALFEARAQVYICLAYLLTINTSKDATTSARTSMWIAAICIGIKGILLTARYFITLGGQTNPDQGVGAHEESFFFDEYVLLFFVLSLADVEPKLRKTMLFMLPFVVMSNLANERRAATAAMIFAIPMMLVLCYVAFPLRRKMITGLVAVAAVVISIYLPAYWNSDGIIAQPARAVRSQFTPDDRDNSSDAYRIAEDANLMATMRSSPIIGYGYGKEIMVVVPMADVRNFDPLVLYLTHDQILWVWMRVGILGFFAFWVMMANFVLKSTQIGTDPSSSSFLRVVGIFAALSTIMLLFFGLLDLQLSNPRDVLFVATWVGIVAIAIREKEERQRTTRFKPILNTGLPLPIPRRNDHELIPIRPLVHGHAATSVVDARPSLEDSRHSSEDTGTFGRSWQ